MADTQIQARRLTAAQIATMVIPAGVRVIAIDTNEEFIGDGATLGGSRVGPCVIGQIEESYVLSTPPVSPNPGDFWTNDSAGLGGVWPISMYLNGAWRPFPFSFDPTTGVIS